MTAIFFTQYVLPVVLAVITSGGITAYFNYRGSREENLAKARQISVSAEVSVADAWRQYAEKVEKRFNELEEKYDGALKERDDEILALKKKIEMLTLQLAKYEFPTK